MSIGQKLKEARLKVELSLADVKQKTGIGESSLSEFENDKREPRLNQLAQLAQAYGRSLSFFLDDQPARDETVLWRRRPEEGGPLLERKFLQLCEQYRRLEEWCNDLIEPQLPKIDPGARRLTYRDAEELARNVGRELNLGDRPAFVLPRVLEEECGVKIFYDEYSPSETSACIKSSRVGWAILLNTKTAWYRRNFDLAHELFHLLTWDLFRSQESGAVSVASDHEEKLADYFASCLLLPGDTLRKSLDRRLSTEGRVPTAVIPELAKQFGVSIEALLQRIHVVYNFGKSREEETRRLIQSIKDIAADGDQTQEALRPAKFPDRYKALAIRAFRNGEISTGKLMEYLELSRSEALSYTEAEGSVLEEVQLTAA